MKKTILVLLGVALAALLLSAAEQQKTYNIRKAYVYQEESLLISESDLNCSFLIRSGMPDSIRIVGAEKMEAHGDGYSDDERLFINAGTRQGLKEGDLMQVVEHGPLVRRPRGSSVVGRYFRLKSLATVTCVYDRRAVITLRQGCYPVQIGDFLIPYKPGQTVFEKKPVYTMCKLPARGIEGTVLFSDIYAGIEGSHSTDDNLLAVDIGSARAKQGNYLLFYRRLASDLPPLILGLGIVVYAEKEASTVKVLETAQEIVKGDRAMLIAFSQAQPGQPGSGEVLPIVQAITDEVPPEPAPPTAQPLMIELLFDFDSAALRPEAAAELEKVKPAIGEKTDYTVTLRGYTCGIGGDAYNLKLSQQRAEAIKAALVAQHGIDAARVEAFFYGENESAYDNTAETERRKNRRVTLEVTVR